jgi:hypothetical protein
MTVPTAPKTIGACRDHRMALASLAREGQVMAGSLLAARKQFGMRGHHRHAIATSTTKQG